MRGDLCNTVIDFIDRILDCDICLGFACLSSEIALLLCKAKRTMAIREFFYFHECLIVNFFIFTSV